jgi:MFS family permease
MFLVLTSLGGAGQLSATTADNSNTILYVLFAVVSIVAGPIVNAMGPRITLSVGALGYALYGASFWSYNGDGNNGFVLFGGAACGVGAAFLWAASGQIMTSYPTESDKSIHITMFYMLSYLGAVVGGTIPVAQNNSNTAAASVNTGTYVATTVLMIVAVFVPFALANPGKIIRSDGTRVVVRPAESLPRELRNMVYSLRKDPMFLLFLPFGAAALFYAPFQANDFNGYFFNVRTRTLNGLLYGIAEFIGCSTIALLDWKIVPRRTRAICGWSVVVLMVLSINICGYFPTIDSHRGVAYTPPLDRSSSLAAKYMTLYFFYGFQDGVFQAFAFWIIGSLSNDPYILSTYSGLYKTFAAVGAAISFGMDARNVGYITMWGSQFAVLMFGCLCLAPLVFIRVKNTSKDETVPPAPDNE